MGRMVISRRGALAAVGLACVGASVAFAGCGEVDSSAPSSDGDPIGDVDSEVGERPVLVITAPHDSSESVSVSEAAFLEDESTREKPVWKDLTVADVRASRADRLPNNIRRSDVYRLVQIEQGIGTYDLPCEIAEDTTLPEGYTYVCVDIAASHGYDQKATCALIDAGIGRFEESGRPSIVCEGEGVEGTHGENLADQPCEGAGAYTVFAGSDMFLWESYEDDRTVDIASQHGYDREVRPGDEVRLQLYYVVAEEDLARGNVVWIANMVARGWEERPELCAWWLQM